MFARMVLLKGARPAQNTTRAQYGADTGNTASTFHEVRTWRDQYQPEGKALIPLRMVGGCLSRLDVS